MRGTRFGVVPAQPRRKTGTAAESLGLVLFSAVDVALRSAEMRADPMLAQWAIRNVVMVSYPHFGVTSQHLLLLIKGMWEEMDEAEARNNPDNNNTSPQQTLVITV